MLYKCVPFNYFWMRSSGALGISHCLQPSLTCPQLCAGYTVHLSGHLPQPSPLCFILCVADCFSYLTYVELHDTFPFWVYFTLHDVLKNYFYYSMRYNILLRLFNAPTGLHSTYHILFLYYSLENTGWFLSFGSGNECCHGHRSMTLNFLPVCLIDLHGHFWSESLTSKE